MSNVQITKWRKNATTDKLNVNLSLIPEEVSLIFRWLEVIHSLSPPLPRMISNDWCEVSLIFRWLEVIHSLSPPLPRMTSNDSCITQDNLHFCRKRNEKLDWMYSAPGQVDREEYLLGKLIDKKVDPLANAEEEVGNYTAPMFPDSTGHIYMFWGKRDFYITMCKDPASGLMNQGPVVQNPD